ncbi:alpha-amylase family protein [Vibrio algicola]|uniref:Uncharacterized protein n=1 Tax=Vibrio algicola TaxID=2662262 RepID=A0A5Q0TNS2_9VIBR|nr:hypothetical protein [Vibrio algicola]
MQRDQLKAILTQQVARYPQPLMVSLYLSGQFPPKKVAEWTQELSDIGLTVYVQDGAGTEALSQDIMASYYELFTCNIGEIREIFKQDQASTEFKASKLSLIEYQKIRKEQSCRQSLLFSLRYMPIENNPFSLVQ